MEKYSSRSEYSSNLNSAILQYDHFFPMDKKSQKKLSSLKISLSELHQNFRNICELNKTIEAFGRLETLDTEGLKENRSAQVFKEKKSNLKQKLGEEREKLESEFIKQFAICKKQNENLNRVLDKEDKEEFKKKVDRFDHMAYEAEYSKGNIPLHDKHSETDVLKTNEKNQHNEQEQIIKDSSKIQQDNLGDLEEALAILTTVFASTHNSVVQQQVREEVAQIKKSLPSKIILASKEVVEKLEHSSQLMLDLDQINEVMQTTYRFAGKDGRLSKLNAQMDALTQLLGKAIREENERKAALVGQKTRIESQVQYATQAVRTYGNILSGNEHLEVEQDKINNNRHGLNEENRQLNQERKSAYGQADVITKNETFSEASKVNQLIAEGKEKSEMIQENNQYMRDKQAQSRVVTLPPEYINMKQKLKELSSLQHLGINQLQDLTQGGMLR